LDHSARDTDFRGKLIVQLNRLRERPSVVLLLRHFNGVGAFHQLGHLKFKRKTVQKFRRVVVILVK